MPASPAHCPVTGNSQHLCGTDRPTDPDTALQASSLHLSPQGGPAPAMLPSGPGLFPGGNSAGGGFPTCWAPPAHTHGRSPRPWSVLPTLSAPERAPQPCPERQRARRVGNERAAGGPWPAVTHKHPGQRQPEPASHTARSTNEGEVRASTSKAHVQSEWTQNSGWFCTESCWRASGSGSAIWGQAVTTGTCFQRWDVLHLCKTFGIRLRSHF